MPMTAATVVAHLTKDIVRTFSILAFNIAVLCACGKIHGQTSPGPLPETVRFNRDIRPILSDNCFQCHGPDKDKRKAKLRLDTEAGALADLDGHHAIVPGKIGESEMYRRITTSEEDDRMPPVKTDRRLTQRQIDLLRLWIAQGAKWEPHWSYIPPARPSSPKVRNQSWAKNPIDQYIQARLEAEGLNPSEEADKRTLIRRLYFDLTGLPPNAAEVREFFQDTSPRAYEKVVDHLLASPHYGERMAMHWLDLVRYADTDGYHADNYRSVYPYRDYVIEAFNSNLPFDRFTIEQLAGDLLPNATTSQKVASTYNKLGKTTEEGGAQAKEYLAKYAGDRVRTTSSVWMGATLGCAECHDHKFDPYTAKDFYSFAAFFADLKEVGVGKPEGVPLPDEQQNLEIKRIDEQIARLEKQFETTTNQLIAVQSAWEKKMRQRLDSGQLAWAKLKPETAVSKNGATLTIREDLSVLASGENPTNDTYSISVRTDREHVTALRLEVLTDPSLDKQSLSRGGGNFVLTTFAVEATPPGSAVGGVVKIATALADYSQKGFLIASAIDDKSETGWAVDGDSKAINRQALFVFSEPVAGGVGTMFTIRLKHESKRKNHNIGRFRLALSTVDKPTLAEHGAPEEAIEALRIPSADRTSKQSGALAKHYLDVAPEVDRARGETAAAKKMKAEFMAKIPTTLMSVVVEPRTMRILPRGNWMDDSGEIVAPAVPRFLSKTESKEPRATRLDLARWIVARNNPLTARTFVNRVWKLYFGTGISKVLDDLGVQGEWPRHPELLDWLATEFMESGWDIKQIVRLLVMSSAYRQSSNMDGKLRERDPYNRWLARQSSFRLDAEIVRDNALAVSGLLVDKIGGPSAKPYQPEGYWEHLNFPKRVYQSDQGAAAYRRGVYTFWCRTFLHPSLAAFDAPGREECTVARVSSNNPLQALVLLNDPTFVEAARVLAEQSVRKGGASFQDRLNFTFHQVLSREPKAGELKLLSDLHRKQRDQYAQDQASAEKLVSTGEWPIPQGIDLPELAAWTAVSRVILNLHETITRY